MAVIDIQNSDLTTTQVDGDGVFDLLMQASKAHLEKEYQANRITGKEYSQVYLGMMQAAMQNAVSFLLGKPQAEKANAEICVLEARCKNEQAQIKDIVDGVPVAGVLGKQKDLYQAQIDGFKRDAEQKLAKTLIDVWNVQRTTDEGFSVVGTGLENAEIKKVVDLAKAGIGVQVS